MFYFKELYFRLLYFLIYLTYSVFFIYVFEDYIFDFFFFGNFDISGLNFETSFIVNSPLDFFEVQFQLSFLFSVLLFYPILVLQIYSFIKSALLKKEKIKIKAFFLNHVSYYILLNVIFLLLIIPNFWYYSEYLNQFFLQIASINVEYEPGLLRFIRFVYFMIIYANLLYLFFHLSIFVFCSFFNLALYFNTITVFNIIFIYLFFISILYSSLFCCILIAFLLLKTKIRIAILFNFINTLVLKI